MSEHVEYCVCADTAHGTHLHQYKALCDAERMYEILRADYPDAYVDITAIDGDGRLSHWVKRSDEVTA